MTSEPAPPDLKALAEKTHKKLCCTHDSHFCDEDEEFILAALQKAHDAGRREERQTCAGELEGAAMNDIDHKFRFILRKIAAAFRARGDDDG